MQTQTSIVTLGFDTSLLESRIEEFMCSGELETLQCLPDGVIRDFPGVLPDILFRECTATLGADGTTHIVHSLDFSGDLEGLRAAVWAAKRGFAHSGNPTITKK
ncbi:MAG: hypothetical protein WA419_01680 [Silvibacterium sp.]